MGGKESESLVDVAKSAIKNPVELGYRIRDLCNLMSQYLEARQVEINVRKPMEAGQMESADFIACERSRNQLFDALSTELKTLEEVTHLARRRSIHIERFLTRFCMPEWRTILGRDPFGTINVALEALDNSPIPTRNQLERFDDCREILALEVEVFIEVLEASPVVRPRSEDGSIRNKDGQISSAKVQKVRDAIGRFEKEKGKQPTRLELRKSKLGIGTSALTRILNQLVEEGTYNRPARRRRRPERL